MNDSNAILWRPSEDRIAAANLTRFTHFVNDRYAYAVELTTTRRCGSGRSPSVNSFGRPCGTSVRSRPALVANGCWSTAIACRGALVSRCTAQFRRESVAPPRRRRGDRVLERSRPAVVTHLCRTLRANGPRGGVAETVGRAVRRSSRSIVAEHSRGNRGHARRGESWGDFQFVLARFWCLGCGRPLRPDRPARAVRGRRLHLRRQVVFFARQSDRYPRRGAVDRNLRDDPLSRSRRHSAASTRLEVVARGTRICGE